MTDLGQYNDRDIDATAMSIRGIGGGLDDPLSIDAEVIPIGGVRMACIPIKVVEHVHAVKKRSDADADDLTLVHIAIGDGPLFFIDPTVVAEARQTHIEKVHLAEQAIEKAKSAKKAGAGKGQQSADDAIQGALGVDRDALEAAHLDGDHDGGVVAECPSCEFEGELGDREAATEAAATAAAE